MWCLPNSSLIFSQWYSEGIFRACTPQLAPQRIYNEGMRISSKHCMFNFKVSHHLVGVYCPDPPDTASGHIWKTGDRVFLVVIYKQKSRMMIFSSFISYRNTDCWAHHTRNIRYLSWTPWLSQDSCGCKAAQMLKRWIKPQSVAFPHSIHLTQSLVWTDQEGNVFYLLLI